MKYPLSLDFGIRRYIFATAALLAASKDWDIDPALMDEADVRMTAFYRRQGGGFLLRASYSIYEAGSCLHLAVVEHGATGETMVFKWTARWTLIPPTTEIPDKATSRTFPQGSVTHVADYIMGQVRKHLTKEHKKS